MRLRHSRPHLCDLPIAFPNNAPASSTAGPRQTPRSFKIIKPLNKVPVLRNLNRGPKIVELGVT